MAKRYVRRARAWLRGNRKRSATPRVKYGHNFWMGSTIQGLNNNWTSGSTIGNFLVGQADWYQGSPSNPAKNAHAIVRRLLLNFYVGGLATVSGGFDHEAWLLRMTPTEAAYLGSNPTVHPSDPGWWTNDNAQNIDILHTWRWLSNPATGHPIDDMPTMKGKDFKNVNWKFKGAEGLYFYSRTGAPIIAPTITNGTFGNRIYWRAFVSSN